MNNRPLKFSKKSSLIFHSNSPWHMQEDALEAFFKNVHMHRKNGQGEMFCAMQCNTM
jgi:hypothetical protein